MSPIKVPNWTNVGGLCHTYEKMLFNNWNISSNTRSWRMRKRMRFSIYALRELIVYLFHFRFTPFVLTYWWEYFHIMSQSHYSYLILMLPFFISHTHAHTRFLFLIFSLSFFLFGVNESMWLILWQMLYGIFFDHFQYINYLDTFSFQIRFVVF